MMRVRVAVAAIAVASVVVTLGHGGGDSASVAVPPSDAGGLVSADHTFPSDEGRIAFSDNTSAGGFDIVTVRPNGTGRRRLTFNEDSGRPAYDPTGRKIAYTRCKGATCAVRLMNADGTRKRALIPAPSSLPAWSPDGTQIAYFREGECCQGQLFIYTVATGESRQLTFGSADQRTRALEPSWSPGGKRIAFVRHLVRESPEGDIPDAGALFVIRTDGTHLKQITPVGRWIKQDPDWSPNGDRIAFSKMDPGAERIPPEAKGIWTIRADGTNLTRLSRTPDEGPTWAPSGNRLAFFRHASESPESDRPGLWTMGKLGNRPRLIFPQFFFFSPDWQPRPKP
jgi:eukaryotic-like serine/threonine-protein kinase